MLEVYIAGITSLENEELFEELIEQVSTHRKEKVLACKSKKDRCRTLAAGLLLKYALQEHKIDEKKMIYQQKPHGKLMLAEPVGLFFNLSHAGDYAVCGISTENVGIDLENVTERFCGERGERRFSALVRKILNEDEKRLLEGLDWREKVLLLGRIWTKKESFSKEDGRGMLLPFSEIDTIKAVYSVDREVLPGYWLSVYQKNPARAEIKWVDFEKCKKSTIEML